MSKDWVRVILNPSAGQGRTRGKLPEIERALGDHHGRSEILLTRGRGHAAELARAAHAEGVNVIAVVGGDGTLNEVVQAYVGPNGEPRPGPDLALIPSGTGGDWRRTVDVAADVRTAVHRALHGRRIEVDLGVLQFEPHPGQRPVQAFLNVASFGLSGAVDAIVKDTPNFVGGRAAFYLATLRAMRRFTNPSVRVRVDGSPWFEGPSMTVAMGNGRYFGGGMLIAPHADPSDGKLSIVSLGNLSKADAIMMSMKIYSGTHVSAPGVMVTTGTRVEAEPTHAWADVLLDVDGEQPGKLPVVATLHRAALGFRV
jgi:YegS/Rv2252/BmrU family lipid kinase